MQVVVFDESGVMDVYSFVVNPTPFSLNEVRWEFGGTTFPDNANYVILEDGVDFASVPEEEIVNQLKYQSKLTLARRYKDGEIYDLANGTENVAREQFEMNWDRINNADSRESLALAMRDVMTVF